MNSLCSLEPLDWAQTHFSECPMGDKRLTRRVITMAAGFARHQGTTIPEIFGDPAQAKAVYRLFSHESATPENLQAAHFENVHRRLHGSLRETILLLEDSSDMIWAGDRAVEGLSQMGQEGINGFVLHSVLAVVWNGIKDKDARPKRMPLELVGLASQQFHLRTPKKPGKSLEERESQLWLDAGQQMGDAPKEGPRWVRVCDRGADIYDFMHECNARGQGYVVRAAQNRRLEESPLLFETVRQAASLGSFQLDLRSRGGRKARTAVLQVSASAITLATPPARGRRGYGLSPVKLNVVRAWEEPHDDLKDPLEWILLTDTPCPDFTTALEVAQIYSTRWVIEEFHKCLKTGMGAEKLQLQTFNRLAAAISIMSIVALRLVDLRERSRLIPDAPAAECGLDEIQIEVLSRWRQRTLHTVMEVAMALGRLGGHMNRKSDGFPGNLTLWKGLRKLTAMTDGYRIAQQPQTYG